MRVKASSANPVDNAIAAGMLKQMRVEYEFPVILGRDFAGVVEEVGSQVGGYAVGDEVFGFLLHADPAVREGSWAELIAVPEDISIAKAPSGVDIAAAGAAPLAGIAALTAIDALDLSEGDTVLVVGATGGVGSFAVQLASRAGATALRPRCPRTRSISATSASANCCLATEISRRLRASATPMASTLCSDRRPGLLRSPLTPMLTATPSTVSSMSRRAAAGSCTSTGRGWTEAHRSSFRRTISTASRPSS